MILPITLTVAAAAAIVNIWLAVRIVGVRMRQKILVGDGENPVLQARMRAQANFVEYAPFILILIAAIEIAGGSPLLLWVLGAIFIIARLAHGLGMSIAKPNPLRAGGALGTWVVLILLAGWAVLIAWQGERRIAPPGVIVPAVSRA